MGENEVDVSDIFYSLPTLSILLLHLPWTDVLQRRKQSTRDHGHEECCCHADVYQ